MVWAQPRVNRRRGLDPNLLLFTAHTLAIDCLRAVPTAPTHEIARENGESGVMQGPRES